METNAINLQKNEAADSYNDGQSANMLFGALWCIGGIVFTAVSYDMVQESVGTYFIAFGAIIYGGWQFLKGLFQVLNN